ncbi:MAG: IS1634 family transposase [Gammaproteobacteria bacterium]
MYIAVIPNRKSPPAILLREGYREGKTVRNRTLANLTHWPAERTQALRRALRGEFDGLSGDPQSGPIFGALFALKYLAEHLGIPQALGRTEEAKRVLFLVLARIAHGGSRLSAVRWARAHAVEDLLGLSAFDEDDLYAALDWLAQAQPKIEQRLYQAYVRRRGQPPVLVLYDVTSSYLEGNHNELGAFGYNRDGKRGKKQIVIGLLTADEGEPLAVRVFEGNTADPSTLAEQITTLKKQFAVEEVVFVGDRGMVKTKGKAALGAEQWKYITALTNAQIRALLKERVLQPDLFDTEISEVDYQGRRLILRRNDAVRYREQERREDKLSRLREQLAQRNSFVQTHRRANPKAGLEQLQRWIKHHKLQAFVSLTLEDRSLHCTVDEEAMARSALLDGCYVLETDVRPQHMDTQTVDARYRDLQQVERNFRTLKTGFLEVRPIFLRKAARTKAHVFIALLALKITRLFESQLHRAFGTTDDDPHALTLDDALTALSRITYLYYPLNGKTFAPLPRPDAIQSAILSALGTTFPTPTATVV